MRTFFFAIVGVTVLLVFSIGFGTSLSTNPSINRIGGSDNNVVDAARGNVTALGWTEEVDSNGVVATKQIKFTVGNEDVTAAHAFEVCAILEAPAGNFQPLPGQTPGCLITSSIPASSNVVLQSLNFTNTVSISDIEKISFSIEELN